MSLRAVIESSVHIEHFRNVDLFNQGFYALRVRMYHEENGNKVYSFPIEISLSETAAKKREVQKASKGTAEYSDVTEGFLDDTEKSFFTRSFLIRYFDEEVEINDMCTFRSEVEVKEGFLNTEFHIEADLFFIELKAMKENKLPEKMKAVIESFPLEETAKSKLKIMKLCHGVSEYFPIIFEGAYFCQFNCTLHSCLVDMRFRPYGQIQESDPSKYDAETEAKFFFGDKNGNIPSDFNIKAPISLKKVDKVYNEYINIFSHMYDRMTGKYKRYISECLEPDQVDKLEERVNVPPLKLPGDELFKDDDSLEEVTRTKPGDGMLSKQFSMEPKPKDDSFGSEDDLQDTAENLSEEKKTTKIPVLKNRQKNFMNKKVTPFSQRHLLTDPIKIAKKFMDEFCYVSFQLLDLWNRILECIRIEPKFVLEFLKVDYEQKTREKLCENIYRKIMLTEDFTCHTEENFMEIHDKYIQERKENGYSDEVGQLIIQDQNLWGKLELHPMLIEHCYQKKGYYPADFDTTAASDADCLYEGYYTGCHMIVFVHGFQGTCTDMKVIKNYFSMLHPEAIFLVSEANHNKTEECIEEMGANLAKEVAGKIQNYCPDSLGRLSFVGHSMGGIIIRAALPHLQDYQKQMFTYLSMASPHLGYMYNSSKIISTGMWLMKNWKKSKSLAQLSMSDESDRKECFLYKLSCQEGLNWFKNVVLCSSYKDSYAPFDSARIQSCTQAVQDLKNGGFYMEMANNILGKMTASSVHRIDVNFMTSTKNVDSFIGRTAHIQFLENPHFMRILTYRFLEFFD